MNWWMPDKQSPYDKLNQYIFTIGVPWDERTPEAWHKTLAEEMDRLRKVLGPAAGGMALDCSCGCGTQAVALAQLGWQVTATDVAASSLEIARQRAAQEQVSIEFSICDMRDLGARFPAHFDWVVTCYGLYEIPDAADIQRAVDGIFRVLKSGGHCYIRLRDMDTLMAEKPRWTFHGEVHTPHGRVFCIEDWAYESATHAVQIFVFLKEDVRYDDWRRWETDAVGLRKRVLGRAELERFLTRAGFQGLTFLDRAGSWMPYEIVAHKAA